MSRPPRRATRALCCLLAATVPLQGCAWLFQSRQSVQVSCAIPGARLLVDGKSMDVGKLALETGVDHVVQCVAEGYAPKTITIAGHDNIAVGWLVCDILWVLVYGTGIVFLVVDFASGSIWDLEPRHLVFNLDRLEPTPDPAELARAERPRAPETRPQTRPEAQPQPEPPLAERVPPVAAPQPTKAPPQQPTTPPPQVTKRPPRSTAEPAPANPLAQTEAKPPTPGNPLAPTPPLATEPAIEARPASATEVAAPPPQRPKRSIHVLTVGVDAPADARLEADPRRAALAARVAGLPGAASSSSLFGSRATRKAALAAVAEREAALGPGDVLFVVIAAPACVDPDGTAWLLLADSDPTAVEDTALGVDVLTGGLERSGAGTTVVAVYAAHVSAGSRDLDAAALGPGIVRVVAHDSKGAESIGSALERTFEDLAGPGVLTDGDGDGQVTPDELAAYLKGRAIACEVAPP